MILRSNSANIIYNLECRNEHNTNSKLSKSNVRIYLSVCLLVVKVVKWNVKSKFALQKCISQSL